MLKVLHVASFFGNIGDNANHKGTKVILEKELGTQICFTNLEIRKAYQNYIGHDKLYFDEKFVQLANNHDLVIIGGGNFFDIWVESSSTGTTIDMSIETLRKIRVPIIFHGLGCDCDPHFGAPPHLVKKFKSFIDAALTSNNCLVSVRNDGSIGTIKKYLGPQYAKKIYHIPDGGFFAKSNKYYHPELPSQKSRIIGVNIAIDMKSHRFKMINSNSIDYIQFIKKLSDVLTDKLNQIDNLHIVFIPHVYSDLEAISDLLLQMNDHLRRNRVTVAPYVQGDLGQDYILDLYNNCDLILGMRFHANVCPIGLNVPTIGLVSYPQIEDLYDELGLLDRKIHINVSGFEKELGEKIYYSLENEYNIRHKYSVIVDKLDDDLHSFHSTIKKKFFS